MYFFTSDTHFGHPNILRYSNRPFQDIGDHDRQLTERWNRVVHPADTVYHLGDFCLGKPERAIELARSLHGHKHLILGNHDRHLEKNKDFLACFESVGVLKTIKIPDETLPGRNQLIVLCHYAMLVWDRSHYGVWQLHGHSHGSLPEDPHALRLDVGVDCHGYRPVGYEQIRTLMGTKSFRPVDHHGARE